jgi:peptidoglycan/xylan/chitin deacetylase (PgdA/CDA1 family)
MPPDPLVSFRVGNVPHARLAWAQGQSFRLPAGALLRSGLACHLDGSGRLDIPADFVAADSAVAAEVRLNAAFTAVRPVSSRLPISYQRVPHWLRQVLAGAVGRWKRRAVERWAAFPRWPLDLAADFLSDALGGPPAAFAGGPTPVLLTHDLDSPEGLRNLVERFLPAEEAVGARSTNYIVPCAWPIDHGLLSEVRRRGHAVGIHGYDHSNRTPFADEDECRRRVEAARPLVERYVATGYRAPSLLRTPRLLRHLASLYVYDSSIPTSGGLFPVPNNGCASARPFRVEGLEEIPLSLPRDGSLRFLGHTPDEIARLWIDCAAAVARSGGVVVLLTHCEERFCGNGPMRQAYGRFLEHVAASDRYAFATPEDVLAAGDRLRRSA